VAAIELLDRAAAASVRPDAPVPDGGCLLVVVATGFEKAVDRQLRDLRAICAAAEVGDDVRSEGDVDGLWSALRELADPSEGGVALLKAAVPPARSAAALDSLRRLPDEAGFVPMLQARAGSGVVYLKLCPETWDAEAYGRLAGLVERARAFARGEGGSLVVEACPTEAKPGLDVWGDPGNAFPVMRALKEKLDPNGTLNPGRFVGGL
jgi:glycolate oxidase FAD binding subunit